MESVSFDIIDLCLERFLENSFLLNIFTKVYLVFL